MSESSAIQAAIKDLFEALSAEPSRALCTKCGSNMVHLDITFFMSGPSEQVWSIPLPVCARCDLKQETARFVPSAIC
jgi:hypothetical protein